MKKNRLLSSSLSMLLAFTLVFSSFACTADAVTGFKLFKDTTLAGTISGTEQTFTFNGYKVYKNSVAFPYASKKADYYYSDGFFTQSATKNNNHLVSISCVAAGATFGGSYSSQSQAADNILNMLKAIGFDKTEANSDYTSEATESTIGVASGVRHIEDGDEDYYVIPIIIRGGAYTREWAGNGDIGDSGNARNFQNAANKAISFVKTNIIDKNSIPADKVKIWITGYSRGASVANLAAKMLTDTYGADDVYAYTFETPLVAVGDLGNYSNIRAYNNTDDIFTYVAPSSFGFGLYGNITYVNSSTYDMTEYKKQVLLLNPNFTFHDNFKEATITISTEKLLKGDYDFSPKAVSGSTMTQQDYINELVNAITTDWGIIPSRAAYTSTDLNDEVKNGDTLENTFKCILDIANNSDIDKITDAVADGLGDIGLINLGYIVDMLLNGVDDVSWDPWIGTGRKDIYDDLWDILVDHGGTDGLTADQLAALKKCWYPLCRVVIIAANKDGADGDLRLIGTLSYNTDELVEDHYPIKALGFMRSKDGYYVACTHSLTNMEKKATTSADGCEAYWKCSKCGEYFSDADGKHEISEGRWKTIAKINADSITLSETSYEYDGTAKQPTVTVKDVDGNKLKLDDDYTVKYSDDTEPGTATATITFQGKYEGTVEKTYSIVAYTISGKIEGKSGSENYKFKLIRDNGIIKEFETSDGTYSIDKLRAGDYTLEVSAGGDYISREYEFTVGKKDVELDVKIAQRGDVNFDGVRTAADITAIAKHHAGITTITDEYLLSVIDTNNDKTRSIADATYLARFIARIISIL